MALDFPTSPSDGQTYSAAGRTWIYSSAAGAWKSATTTQPGYTGSIGNLGYTGSRGDTGFTGSIGFTGSLGFTGSRGFTGSQGDRGFTGSASTVQGFTGSIGFTGSRGEVGFTGSASTVQGFTGSRGFTGSIGFTGSASTLSVLSVTDNTSGASVEYPVFVGGTGNQAADITTTKLTWLPSTGALTVTGILNVDNIRIDGNTISSTATNSNIVLDTNGTGVIVLNDSMVPSSSNTLALGSATLWFANVYALASRANYADLAEKFIADADYDIGTVLMIGGNAEVTAATKDSRTIVGTVSENPGFIMNDGLEGDNVVAVSYLGRVPCKVEGDVKKGDLLVVSNNAGVATSTLSTEDLTGKVVGKALESNHGSKSIIEILIGRL